MKTTQIITDLDGTLLNDAHRLPDYTKEHLTKLIKGGLQVSIATGRHYADVQAIGDILGINGFLITSNGAMVHNANNEMVLCETIDGEIVKDILLNFEMPSTTQSNMYTHSEWITNKHDTSLEDYHQDSGFTATIIDFALVENYNAIKLYFIEFDPDKLAEVEQSILSKYDDLLSVTYAMPFCLEVMKKGVSKGNAIQQIWKQNELQLDSTYAFGDGLNDLEMLQTVGKPFRMGNASAALKEATPHLPSIGTNAENAVVNFLLNEIDL